MLSNWSSIGFWSFNEDGVPNGQDGALVLAEEFATRAAVCCLSDATLPGLISRVHSFVLQGIDALPCEVEVDFAGSGLPRTTIVGLPDTAVRESADRVRTALENSGFEWPRCRLTVNLAPADLRKEGPVYDLAMAVGILAGGGALDPARRGKSAPQALDLARFLIAGELALDGRLRPVKGAVSLAILARRLGSELLVPTVNAREAALVDGVRAFGFESLPDVIAFLRGEQAATPVLGVDVDAAVSAAGAEVDFVEVRGQEAAKRAMLIAAAGGHNLLMIGAPGSGKSNFIDALLVNLANLHGWSFALFSPENQPVEDHMARVVEKYVDKPFSRGPTPRMESDELAVGMEWAHQHFRWILPHDEAQWEIGWILARATELVYRHGIRGLVIDPWNELEPQRGKDETETEYVSRVLRTVRQWGRRHGVHVWMVVHPTKLQRDQKGQYPVPTLYDAAGSAHWRNKADNGLCIWRDLNPDSVRRWEVDVHIQKIRFRQIGRLGKVTLRYRLATATYADLDVAVPAEDDGEWQCAD